MLPAPTSGEAVPVAEFGGQFSTPQARAPFWLRRKLSGTFVV
jgi:hypothetical protein